VENLLRRLDDNCYTALRLVADGRPIDGLTRHARAVLKVLHKLLVEPVADYLEPGQRLAIVPYGVLHGVPFHALVSGMHYLVEKFEITTCPSSALLRACMNRPRRPRANALVMGHSAGGSLPYALEEARLVATLLSGDCHLEEAARPSVLMNDAKDFGVVHVAAHGEARLDNPIFSHLLQADGLLQMSDVFHLPLSGALVTLSGCETGRPAVTRGDEVLGLSHGFIHAGASTVIHSLWRVADAPASEQMIAFYTALQAGAGPCAALRAAQCAMLQRYPHPALWATFQAVGAP
jgi:CHAT domain-containing protein